MDQLEFVNMAKVLLAGGAGFLGSHFADVLLADENELIILDNLVTGNRRNIDHLMDSSKVKFIEHDIIEPLKGIDCDIVMNLACPASPPAYQKDPVFTAKTSMFGTYNLLELARANNATFFQASTSEVYGDPEVHPQAEEYWGHVNPIGTRSCYDEGKRIGETLCFDFHRKYGTKVRIVRIFNTYGPRMDPQDGRVVSNFIQQAISGEGLTIYGDGSQTRSFCYVSDLISGMYLLLKSPDFMGPVNIGNPGEFTIKELADLVLKKTGSGSAVVNKELPLDDPKQRRPDISLAIEKLAWRPEIDLIAGLEKTIPYFQKLLNES